MKRNVKSWKHTKAAVDETAATAAKMKLALALEDMNTKSGDESD